MNKMEEKVIKKLLKIKAKNKSELEKAKKEIAQELKINILSNFEILKWYQDLLRKKKIKRKKWLEKILKKKPIRSLSGIVNVSVLTKPFPCPGTCIFCPTEKGFPKSYLGGEPAAERAKKLDFDPFLQVKKRVNDLKIAGHPSDKIELRIIGGTFSFYEKKYQAWFFKECFRGANNEKRKIQELERLNLRELIRELKSAQKRNEKAKNRIVGISVETRPDFITEKEVNWLRILGVTLVELGVQSVFNEILRKNKTKFSTENIVLATKLLKDAGFKVLYHLMPNLYGANFEKDLKTFEIVFSNENFKPDWLKIYPTVVTRESQLYKIWENGKYKPYSEKELIKLLFMIKKVLPYWVRVTRVFRDIPAPKIVAGCKISNLREVVKKEMEKRGFLCRCIRCREVREKYDPKEKIYLFREDYDASGGKEIFLSFENKERTKLFSYLRLRIPSQIFEGKKHFITVLENSAIIREIQTFGETLQISEKKVAPQHRGLGKKLIKEAEKITKNEFNLKKIAVISGVGVREYWRKFGYKLKETYMIKAIL
jgi:elongator complex protein 3